MEIQNQSDKEKYLLEQYKAYMNNLNEIGSQHSQTRAFYVSIISALLVFLSVTASKNESASMSMAGQLAVASLGIILCVAWYIHMLSYRKLFTAKFFILKEMENELYFHIFEKEWDKLESIKYKQFIKIESFVSLAVAIPFIILLFVFIYRICCQGI